jgi:peptidoglycan LD-endopeptidase LytH
MLLLVFAAVSWQLQTRAPAHAPMRIINAEVAARTPGDNAAVEARDLLIPVAGVSAAQLLDSFDEWRGNRPHQAIDIASAAGTEVYAVAAGRVVKLFLSKPGGITVYQFDQAEAHVFYYAHLERYAEGLAEGQLVARGDLIGFVGSTGNASPAAPHLHFAIMKREPGQGWWQGEPINPFAPLGGIARR